MAKSLANVIRDARIDTDLLQRVITIDNAKAPEVYEAILDDSVTFINGALLVLIDGGDVEVVICNAGETYSTAVKLSAGGGGDSSLPTVPETGTFVLTATDGVLSWEAQA